MPPMLSKTRHIAMEYGSLCFECPLRHNLSSAIIPKKRRQHPTLTILGEVPGPEEEKKKEFFVGRSGELIDRSLNRFNIPLDQVYKTNTLLCHPGREMLPAEWRKAIECCRPRLWAELKGCRTIMACGSKALQTMVGKAAIMPWFGQTFKVHLPLNKARLIKDRRHVLRHHVLPSFHPEYALRNRAYIPIFQILINRAWQIGRGTLQPWRKVHVVLKPGKAMVAALRMILKSWLPVGVDIETIGINPLTNSVSALGISNRDIAVSMPWDGYDAGKYGAQKPLKHYNDYAEIQLLCKEILETKNLVMQNGQHDVLGLKTMGFKNINYQEDTLYKHAVVAPKLGHDLGHMCAIEHWGPRWKTIFGEVTDAKGSKKYVTRDPYTLRDYNAEDSWRTVILNESLDIRLGDTHNGEKLYAQYMDLARLAALPMRERGILTSPETRKIHRGPVVEAKNKAWLSLRALAAESGIQDFNPASLPQRASLFFEKLKCKVSKRTPQGKPSLDEEALTQIIGGTNYRGAQAAKLLLEYRKQDKILGTYIDGLAVDKDNIIHPCWRVDGARTGRWSAQTPNMQNIPKDLRNIAIARPRSTWVSADYSQLELVILATLAGAEKLLSWIDEGLDLHTMTASELFKCPPKNIEKHQRSFAKTFNYASAYLADDETIWKKIIVDFPNTPYGLVPTIRKKWNRLHREIPEYQARLIAFARRDDYIEIPLSGRRHRFFGEVKETEVVNTPIQGTAADLINRATLEVAKEIKWGEEGMLAQVHDELNLEGPDVPRLVELLKSTMGTEISFPNGQKRSFAIDVSVGGDWGNLGDYKC